MYLELPELKGVPQVTRKDLKKQDSSDSLTDSTCSPCAGGETS